MTKGLPRSNSRAKPQSQAVRRQRIVLTNKAVTVSGATGVGFGTTVIGDLPEGNIHFMSAVGYLRFTRPAASTGILATFEGDYAIGTEATIDADVADTNEANILPSTSMGVAATSGVSPTSRSTNITGVMLDNTDGSLELNLNVMIDDASINAASQAMTADGYVDLVYAVLGDD